MLENLKTNMIKLDVYTQLMGEEGTYIKMDRLKALLNEIKKDTKLIKDYYLNGN